MNTYRISFKPLIIKERLLMRKERSLKTIANNIEIWKNSIASLREKKKDWRKKSSYW